MHPCILGFSVIFGRKSIHRTHPVCKGNVMCCQEISVCCAVIVGANSWSALPKLGCKPYPEIKGVFFGMENILWGFRHVVKDELYVISQYIDSCCLYASGNTAINPSSNLWNFYKLVFG